MRMFRKLMALAYTAALISPEAAAVPFNSATLRRIIDGREVFIDRRQASVNETADRGQELSTGSSRAEVLFDRRALGFLGNNTLIRLGEDCFRLDRGQVLVNGPQNTCLGSKVLGIRGTTYVLSLRDDETYELAVLSGAATVGDAIEETEPSETPNILSMYVPARPRRSGSPLKSNFPTSANTSSATTSSSVPILSSQAWVRCAFWSTYSQTHARALSE